MTLSVAPDYLILQLRLRMGDTNSAAYRYLDEWLKIALVTAVKGLARYWNHKYLVDNSNRIYRNPHTTFLFQEPSVIQNSDEDLIVLVAAIMTLEGSLENNSWNAVSWRDAEIAFSNLEQFRAKEGILKTLLEEKAEKIKPPTKRLIWPGKGDLPGYKDNKYETKDEY